MELTAGFVFSFQATLTAFEVGAPGSLHLDKAPGECQLSWQYAFQLLWLTMLVTWLGILLGYLRDRKV